MGMLNLEAGGFLQIPPAMMKLFKQARRSA